MNLIKLGQALLKTRVPKTSVYDYVCNDKRNQSNMKETAVMYGMDTYTRSEIQTLTDQLAKSFRKIGVTRGTLVPTLLNVNPETLAIYLSLVKIGAIAVPIETKTSIEGIQELVRLVDADLIVADDQYYNKVEKTRVKNVVYGSLTNPLKGDKHFAEVFPFAPELNDFTVSTISRNILIQDFIEYGQDHEDVIPVANNPDDLAVIGFTGGTTQGKPKAVKVSNYNILTALTKFDIVNTAQGFKRQIRKLDFIPQSFVAGYLDQLLSYKFGYISQQYPFYMSDGLAQLFNMYQPEDVKMVPSFHNALAKAVQEEHVTDLSYVTSMGSVAEILHPEDKKRIEATYRTAGYRGSVISLYGASETTATCIAPSPSCQREDSLGVTVPLSKVGVFDPETLRPLPDGQVGEIWIAGKSVVSGYYKNPEADQANFYDDARGTHWFRTGDLGYRDPKDKNYIQQGRMKRMLTVDAYKIYPETLESLINADTINGLIEQCVIVPAKDELRGTVPVACLVTNCDISGREELIRDQINILLSHAPTPKAVQISRVYSVSEIPLTAAGKKDVLALEKQINQAC